MDGLYSNINMNDNSPKADLEDVLMEIAVQTIECGIFLQQYMSNTGRHPDIFSGVSSSSVDSQSLPDNQHHKRCWRRRKWYQAFQAL